MSRRRMPGSQAISACVGTLLFLLPQLVLAELRFASPERAADMHDYVRDHVVCDDASCAEEAEFEGFDDEPAYEDSQEDNACAERWWVRADYLMWWVQGNRLPPLVTTSPEGIPPLQAGVLHEPGTSVLFGGQSVDDDLRHGVRLTLGAWLDACQDWGMEGHYLYVGDAGGGYQAGSDGNPILARPFYNLDPQVDAHNSQLVAFPGAVQGQIRIDTASDVNSAGLLLRRTMLRGCQGEIAFVGGYRYFRFRERLTIDEDRLITDPLSYGATFQVQDSFAVQNDFHGGEIGLAAEMQRGRWSLDALTKLGVGGVRQRLDIAGRTLGTAPPDPTDIRNYGLLAQTSNIGQYSDTNFAFLPELGVNLGYCVTSSLSLRAGYSLLWLTDALRTGDQIDLDIGTGASGTYPQATMDTTSVCVQGVNLGLEWRR
ncbi:MAG: BBP7 family outer membrane beta-barrel protein [Pirellulaceae bacterium]|nr:BBP7 family outer membrane beta-barrel protein [Pirellulaceae bacterium]